MAGGAFKKLADGSWWARNGTSMAVASTATDVQLTSWNSGGHKDSSSDGYTYDSNTGGSIGG